MTRQIAKEACFDDVFDAQKNFRILLDALSRPGKVYTVHKHNFAAFPPGFNPNILTILKTLCDNCVSFSVCMDNDGCFERYIEINTGAQLAVTIGEADYVLFDGNKFNEDFNHLKTGTLDFPEDSATAVISVEKIRNDECSTAAVNVSSILMSGPGIKDKNIINIAGLDPAYVKCFTQINAVFPFGIDVIFVDVAGNIACMARTTKAGVQ